MGAPQIIMLILFSSNLAEAWIEDSDRTVFIAECISIAIWIGLLCWGGFFK